MTWNFVHSLAFQSWLEVLESLTPHNWIERFFFQKAQAARTLKALDAGVLESSNQWSSLVLEIGSIARSATLKEMPRDSEELRGFIQRIRLAGDVCLRFLSSRKTLTAMGMPAFTGFTAEDIQGRLGMLEHYEDILFGPKNTAEQTSEMDSILASL